MLFLLACMQTPSVEATGPASPAGGDSGEAAICEVSVLSSYPADGESRLPTDVSLEVSLSVAAEDATLELVGVEGKLERLEEGKLLRWTPLSALEEGKSYLMRAGVCGKGVLSSFTTRYPVVQAELEGRVYDLDLAGSHTRWEEPAELGALLTELLGGPHLMVEVEHQEREELELEMWTQVPGEDSSCCMPPTHFRSASFSENPWFDATAREGWLRGGEAPVALWRPTLSGTFSEDGSQMIELRVEAMVEADPLSVLLGQDLCDVLECASCPGDHACFPLAATATEVPEGEHERQSCP